MFDGQLREGQAVVVPQNFAVAKQAGEEGFEAGGGGAGAAGGLEGLKHEAPPPAREARSPIVSVNFRSVSPEAKDLLRKMICRDVHRSSPPPRFNYPFG